jgi:hypothetical protein
MTVPPAEEGQSRDAAANFDLPPNHPGIERRSDGRVLELRSGSLHRGFELFDPRLVGLHAPTRAFERTLRDPQLQGGIINLTLRQQPLVEHLLVAFVGLAAQGDGVLVEVDQCRSLLQPRLLQLRIGLLELRHGHTRVQGHEHLSCSDAIAFLHMDGLDQTRRLGTKFDGD